MEENFTEKEKQIVERNIKNAGISLRNKIDNINTGLNLMGVYAEINSNNKNQLDFYYMNGSYISSKIMGYTRDFVKEGYGKEPYAEIMDYGREYSFDIFNFDSFNDRYLFRKHSYNKSGIGYSIELYFNNVFNTLKKMYISSYHSEDDCIIKEFEISDIFIRANVENAFGPSGNYEDGEEREIWFNSDSPKLFMTEAVWPKQGKNHRQISSGSLDEGVILSYHHYYGDIPALEMKSLMLNITRHPRNKELINYVLNEYEKMIPGIKKFASDNFKMYGNVLNEEYVSDEITDNLINDTIMERCNFENIKGAKARKLTQNNNI